MRYVLFYKIYLNSNNLTLTQSNVKYNERKNAMLHSKLISLIPIKDSDSVVAVCNVTGTSKNGKECNFYTSAVLPKTGIHANVGDNVSIISNGNYARYVVTE